MSVKSEILLEVKDMSKNFGVTVALDHVSFAIKRGEIRGLIGENGSGNRTASSIIAGIQPATSGEMLYKGKPWKPANTLDAIHNAIGMIVQEAGTISDISISENIFIGNYKDFRVGPFINRTKMNAEAKKALENIGITYINPALRLRILDMQERKLVEIAKTMYPNPEILIVDETTTALSQTGRQLLYKIMRKTAEEGKAVLFISHDLDELMEHCDTLTILRDGRSSTILKNIISSPAISSVKW